MYNHRVSIWGINAVYLPIPDPTFGALEVGIQPLTEAAIQGMTLENWMEMEQMWVSFTFPAYLLEGGHPTANLAFYYRSYIGARAPGGILTLAGQAHDEEQQDLNADDEDGDSDDDEDGDSDDEDGDSDDEDDNESVNNNELGEIADLLDDVLIAETLAPFVNNE